MFDYNNCLDFFLDFNDIKKLKKYILKSSYYKSSLNDKLNKALIIKTSLYISLLFFLLLLFKIYLFFIEIHQILYFNNTVFNSALFIELFFKAFIIFILCFFIFIYLNKINNSYLISHEIERLNLFIGENKFYLSNKDIKIVNNKLELLINFSDIDTIFLYDGYIIFTNNKKLLCVIKCNDTVIKRTLGIKLQENFKKQILIKEI